MTTDNAVLLMLYGVAGVTVFCFLVIVMVVHLFTLKYISHLLLHSVSVSKSFWSRTVVHVPASVLHNQLFG